jgi:hypothetical protein
VADTTTAPAAAPTAPFDIEQPACFYLGREYDLDQKAVRPDKYVMYDARDLTTHGVVVGMTGSGKTGLCISLLEEAAIDGVPCVIIDPKGDLTNLLLQFPDLDPKKFQEWLNEEDARQKGLTPEVYGKQLSDRWRKGLEETAQTPDRIARLKAASDQRIYTPGSEAGLPLSILGTFAAPKGKLPLEDLNHKIEALATALLGLTGVQSDPVQSREHILISNLLLDRWQAGRDVDLTGLIQLIEKPPIKNVGAYAMETFFPARERVKFAATLNNVLAAPSFKTWTTGDPLDLTAMLYRGGRPQQVIFYTAHLDDTQRMFFTTLLLEEVLAWTRKQAGTSNLRALVYFDEVYGYLPPTANPPSKRPLLTLLKQARAFGVGVLLATQNPMDLDYKALSNAGTWFVGKLQTERDKARLLEGMESAAAEHGALTDHGKLEKIISSLGNRIFLLHDIHRPAPVLFQTRWSLSFLRGPLTREQVGKLMAPLKEQPAMAIPLCAACGAELGPDVTDRCQKCGQPPWKQDTSRLQDKAFREALTRAAAPLTPPPLPPGERGRGEGAAPADASLRRQPPVLPPDVRQFYLPLSPMRPAGAEVVYYPYVLGVAEVLFVMDKRTGKEHRRTLRRLAEAAPAGHPVAWDKGRPIRDDLAAAPEANAAWGEVPEALDTGKKLKALERAFIEFLYAAQKLALFENRTLGLVGEPGEGEQDFRKRCEAAAEQEKQKALEMERVKFAPKFEALEATAGDEAPAKGRGRTARKSGSVSRQEEKRRKLQADYQSKQDEITEKWRRIGEEATPIQLKPRKADVRVTHFGIGWAPYWRVASDGKVVLAPAYR